MVFENYLGECVGNFISGEKMHEFAHICVVISSPSACVHRLYFMFSALCNIIDHFPNFEG